jgi:hypothetical protein
MLPAVAYALSLLHCLQCAFCFVFTCRGGGEGDLRGAAVCLCQDMGLTGMAPHWFLIFVSPYH